MQQWEARLTLNGMSFACGNIEIEFERDWILFYGLRQEHFERLEEAFERAYEISINNPFPKIETRTKEEIIEYAKAHGACKKGIRRFQNDEPLTYKDLQWSYKHSLDLSEEVYLRAVKENGLVLQHIPEEHLTHEICLEGIKKHGLVLGYVPRNQLTHELCLTAVKENGSAIQFVPENQRTYKICLEAVKECRLVLKYVPEEHRQKIETELN